jgi:hypothetical protein
MKPPNEKYANLSHVNALRPTEHLLSVGKMYPGIWKVIDLNREAFPHLPSWCHLPENLDIYGGVKHDGSASKYAGLSPIKYCVPALATWRLSQGIFTFEKELLDTFWDTSIRGKIPASTLDFLPHHCVYIDTG